MLNVSERSVRSARVVLDKGIAELQHAVEQGHLAVSAAAQAAVKLSPQYQKRVVAEAAAGTSNPVKKVIIEASREDYNRRAERGGGAENLETLIRSGRRFPVIYADPPWSFHTYSGKGKQRSAERYYDTMSLDDIRALPVEQLAADDAALFLWGVCPEVPGALEVISAWGFEFKTKAFTWIKTTAGGGLHTGMGHWTRANSEDVWLATRGNPQRLAMDVHQVIMAPVGEHSEKPEEAYSRIERLLAGPYLELFARSERDGWVTWGNELNADQGLNAPPELRRAAS